MKKNLGLLVVLIISMSKIYSQNILSCYNNTDKAVYFAYAYYDADNSCWSSKGWYNVKAYQQFDIDLGDYTGKVYIHGLQKAYLGLTENTWGSGYEFCVDPDNAFEIRNADKISCSKKVGFSERKIGPGKNKWEFNP